MRSAFPAQLLLALAFAVGGVGCVRQRVTVSPWEILHHVPALRKEGRARVEVEPSGHLELTVGRVLEVELETCRESGLVCRHEKRKLTVGELIASCPDVPPFRTDQPPRTSDCLLLATRSERIPVGRRLRPDWDAWKAMAGAAVVIVVVGVAVGYVIDCGEPDDGC